MGGSRRRRRDGNSRPLKLEWYDRAVANLARMRAQDGNITCIYSFCNEIVIERNGEGVDIYGDGPGLLEGGYEPVALSFPTLQEAIEFDYGSYDRGRTFYFS